MIFEGKIANKTFGPTRTDDGYWRIKTNEEINDILKGQNIYLDLLKKSLNWLGQVERVAGDNIVQKVERWKPLSERAIGRPKTLWEDGVLASIKSINRGNWKKVTQSRDSGRKWLSKPEHCIGCGALQEEGGEEGGGVGE